MSSDLHVVCGHCGAINRLPGDKPALAGKCGQCGRRLFEGRPLAVDAVGLRRHIERGGVPLLVDFWAPWCGPCRAMAPVFERAAAELEPAIRLLKVNSDEEQDLAARLSIRSIPTLVLFQGGREVARIAGAMDHGRLMAWVRNNLKGEP